MADSEKTALCKCGQPHDDWPGNDGSPICQMCWERECSESWWQMVNAFNSYYAASRIGRGD